MPNESRKFARSKLDNFRVRVQIEADTRDDVWTAAKSMGVYITSVKPNRRGKGYYAQGNRILQRNQVDAKFAWGVRKLLADNVDLTYEHARPLLQGLGVPIADELEPNLIRKDQIQFNRIKREWLEDQEGK